MPQQDFIPVIWMEVVRTCSTGVYFYMLRSDGKTKYCMVRFICTHQTTKIMTSIHPWPKGWQQQAGFCNMDVGPIAGGPSPVGEKMDDGTSEEVQEKDEDVCALFATSVPRDIWANPSLAALAGLIDEDEDQKDESANQAERGILYMLLIYPRITVALYSLAG